MATPTLWLPAFTVNTGAAANEPVEDPRIVGLANGNFLVAWEENSTTGATSAPGIDIIGKIYDAEGNVVRDSYRISTTRNSDNEEDFDVAATNDGGFILVYVDNDGADSRIIWERKNAAGNNTNDRIIVSETGTDRDYDNPQVAVDQTNNTSIVTFTDLDPSGFANPADDDVRGVRLNSVGTIITGETDFGSNDGSSDDEDQNAVAINTNGEVVSAYRDEGEVKIDVRNTSGALQHTVVVDDTGNPNNPSVATLSNGRIAVTWVDDGDQVNYAVYTSNLGVVQGKTPVNNTDASEPEIVALPDGGFVIVWDDDTAATDDIFALAYTNSGATDGSVFRVDSGATNEPDIGVTGDGRILFTWDTGSTIEASIWDPREGTLNASNYEGTPRNFVGADVVTTRATGTTLNGDNLTNDTLLGQAGNDLIRGFNGNDSISGGGGNDALQGGNNLDSIDGGAGNDIIQGDAGRDTLDGGTGDDVFLLTGANNVDIIDGEAGTDTLDASAATFAINVNASGSLTGSGLAGSITSIENIIGSNQNDTILTTGNTNTIDGGAGDDTIDGGSFTDSIDGGAGNDTIRLSGGSFVDNIDGGTGTDILDASAFNLALQVDLTGSGTLGGSGPDTTITRVESIIGTAGSDTINLGDRANTTADGGSGNDTITGGTNRQSISGGAGNDTIDGGFAAGSSVGDDIDGGMGLDTITGANGSDTIDGGDGNDSIDANGGNDTIQGGTGDDLILGGSGADSINGGIGNDTASYSDASSGVRADLSGANAGTGDATGDTFFAVENLTGSNFGDSLYGNSVANVLNGGSGLDFLFGNGGDDTLSGGSGDDRFIGGAGGDLMIGGTGTDRAQYTDSAAGLTVDLQFSNLNTGIATGDTYSSIEDVFGSNEDDSLRGDAGNNFLVGRGGEDVISGRDGNDTLNSGSDTDLMLGGNGNDTMIGGQGNDIMRGGEGADEHDGGQGVDRASYRDINSGGVRADLENAAVNTGAAAGDTYTSVENLYGTNSDDNLRGDDRQNVLSGEGGNDVLRGRDGVDLLVGGAGDDVLIGGGAVDRLLGQAGADSFRFDAPTEGVDRVLDFEINVDTVVLNDLGFTSLSAGTLSAANFRSGNVAADANDYIIYNSATGRLFYDADGNGAGARQFVAIFTNNAALDADDFTII